MTTEKSPAQPGRSSYACLLRKQEVCRRVGFSASELYRRIAAGDFPRQVRLGTRTSAWPENEVSDWIAGRIAERDAKAGAA